MKERNMRHEKKRKESPRQEAKRKEKKKKKSNPTSLARNRTVHTASPTAIPPTSHLIPPTSNFPAQTHLHAYPNSSPEKYLARCLHSTVLSNIVLKEPTLFMCDMFCKYENMQTRKRKI
jgi:hypothetical protein